MGVRKRMVTCLLANHALPPFAKVGIHAKMPEVCLLALYSSQTSLEVPIDALLIADFVEETDSVPDGANLSAYSKPVIIRA